MKDWLMFTLILLSFIGMGSSCEKPEIEDPNGENTVKDTVYYVTDQSDFDRLSGFYFPPGSTIAFEAGATFTGQFLVRGNGLPEHPNLVTAYDPASGELLMEWTHNKPVINGEGKRKSALYIHNSNYWKINNIEVTNTDGTYEDQGEIFGIYVVAEDVGVMIDITVSNCYVHKVNGNVGGKETGGIRFDAFGDGKTTKFQDVLIENNVVSRVGGVGIANQSSHGNIRSDDFQPWTGYVVRGNRVEYTGRNGIIVRYAIDPLVEYNVAAFNSRYDVGHSIFNFNTVNCIVQYNEAYGNTSDDLKEIDRGGFDCDFNSKNTIYQYNYSHNNHWFIAIQRRDINHGVIIRYNISENESLGAYMYGFPEYDGLTNVEIYNNTHYFGKGTGNRIFIAAGKDRIPTQTKFTNNIFYFEDEATWGFDPDNTCILDNNLFYNVTPKGTNAVTSDPLFVNPGTGGFKIDMTDPDRLAGYRLKPGSPALKTGKAIPDNGGLNFAGETLGEDALNMGAL
jgi:hypothetical protein